MVHFNWTQLIPQVGHEYVHVATLSIATGITILLGLIARFSLGSGKDSVIPVGKTSVRGIFENLTDFIYEWNNEAQRFKKI